MTASQDEPDELGMTKDNWLFIYVSLRSDRRVSYRARGMGENYQTLWKYLNLVDLVDEHDDFPWSYWKFADPTVERRFREIYAPLIHVDPIPMSGFASFDDMENTDVQPAENAWC